MTNNRVRAFTILEVTITMLIASLLIGFTYTAYSIVVRSYSSFNHKNQDMAELVRLDEWLKKDFAHADSVEKDTAGLVFNSIDHHVKYLFEPDFILRNEIKTDTFKIKTENIVTSFESQPVTAFSANREQDRLDDLELDILFQNEKIPYHYHKEYSSANLINRNPNALH
jgi:Tfp pilus assembly protein PilE